MGMSLCLSKKNFFGLLNMKREHLAPHLTFSNGVMAAFLCLILNFYRYNYATCYSKQKNRPCAENKRSQGKVKHTFNASSIPVQRDCNTKATQKQIINVTLA